MKVIGYGIRGRKRPQVGDRFVNRIIVSDDTMHAVFPESRDWPEAIAFSQDTVLNWSTNWRNLPGLKSLTPKKGDFAKAGDRFLFVFGTVGEVVELETGFVTRVPEGARALNSVTVQNEPRSFLYADVWWETVWGRRPKAEGFLIRPIGTGEVLHSITRGDLIQCRSGLRGICLGDGVWMPFDGTGRTQVKNCDRFCFDSQVLEVE